MQRSDNLRFQHIVYVFDIEDHAGFRINRTADGQLHAVIMPASASPGGVC